MESGGEKRGRGRPKKEGGKGYPIRLNLRLSDEDFESLNFISKELKTTRSKALRTLIREGKNILKN